MLSVRHLVAEKLEAERAVLEARQQLAKAESGAEGVSECRDDVVLQQLSALEGELELLAAEVQSLRCLQQDTQDKIHRGIPDVEEATSLFNDQTVLEQVKGMLKLKQEVLGKKKDKIDKLRKNAGTRKARQAAVIDVELLASQQACVATMNSNVQELEARFQRLDVALEAARPQCVDCFLVLFVSVSCEWHKQARPVPWYRIDDFLKAQWALRYENEIMLFEVCRPILTAISAARMVPTHVLEVVKGTDITYLRIGAGDAGQMAIKARTGAVPVTSMEVLKAALGASPQLCLCQELTDYFHGRQDDFQMKGILAHKCVPLPAGLMGQLRPYQRIGFNWLANMASDRLGCILADDMGLGKTAQCITTLLHLKEHGQLKYPALILTPVSLITSWASEFGKWAPSLIVHIYLGANRHLLANARREVPMQQAGGWMKRRSLAGHQPKKRMSCRRTPPLRRSNSRPMTSRHAHIFLTSYATFRSDLMNLMEDQCFGAIVLDEAQAIKNHSSALSKAAKQIAAEVPIRIAVSGTPVENRASDLHSLFEFVMPGYLGSRTAFEASYGRPLLRQGASSEPAAGLQKLIRHFMLRRVKTDPAISKDLPARLEQNHFVELTAQQAGLYEHVRAICMQKLAVPQAEQASLPKLLGNSDACAASRSTRETSPLQDLKLESQRKFAQRANVFRMLHALRQICNHPSNLDLDKWPEIASILADRGCLVDKRHTSSNVHAIPSEVEASGKTMLLHVLLEQIFGQGEKAVIFCQYLRTVDMLSLQIQENFGITPQTLVGECSMETRAQRVEEFQQLTGPGAIILTLGVGGIGITLHAARHVIHFDRCYNPAKENQGSDRVHRIGQKATCVFIHRLITRGTFEERVDAILEQKRRLCGLTMPSGENWIADLNQAELLSLFEPGQPSNKALDKSSDFQCQQGSSRANRMRQVGAKRPVRVLQGTVSALGGVKFHRTSPLIPTATEGSPADGQ